MNFAASCFMASAAITGLLGSVHMLYTFFGNKLHPRDEVTVRAMQTSHLVLTRKTTVWRAAKGFNASHSLGVLLFALVFGHLAGWHFDFLQQSVFLVLLGMLCLLIYGVLAWKYWFSIPLYGIALASVLFAAGLVSTWTKFAL